MINTKNTHAKLAGSKVAIIGLGIEGAALCEFLIDKVLSITVLDKLDPAKIEEKVDQDLYLKISKVIENERITKVFGSSYMDSLDEFDIIFRSPSVYFADPKLLAASASGVKISSQIDLFFDLCPCQIVGVTGTKGKGTTATLISEILKKAKSCNVFLAGNIGYPAITLIPEIKSDDIVILELSNFQLADLGKSPQVAVVTNVYVDHLDYHKSTEEYRTAKFNILAHQQEGDIAVLNKKSSFSTDELVSVKSKIRYFGSDSEDAIVCRDKVILDPAVRNLEICGLMEINLFGRHNLENIAAATLVADSLGVDAKTISVVVKKFVGLPHRLELVREINGMKFINDSFATNPEPTIAAIESFRNNKILILGGSSKGADFHELANKITSENVKVVVLIGREASRIKEALLDATYSGTIIDKALDFDAAVQASYDAAKEDDVIIFSPACASFDMFKNYKDRGDKFKAAVLNLPKK
ncbi:MAG: UDP-N-acetylmuramoyl-L-alanine--D-glutamate ligase [Candidatus Berkelbacteria bacterium]